MKATLIFLLYCLCAMGQAGEIPGWGFPTVSGECRACNANNDVGPIEVNTLFRVDLGPGSTSSHLGSVVIRSHEGGSDLGSPSGLRLETDTTTPDLEVVYDSYGRLAQIVTPKLIIDASTISSFKYSLKILTINSKGPMSGGRYGLTVTPSNLIKEFAIENPDGAGANNRLKIVDTGNLAEWNYTYNGGNSTWSLIFPNAIGSLDMISTNHSATSWSVIKRYRNPLGSVIAQRSQLFTNISWGRVMLEEVEGIGQDARTNRWTYYEGNAGYSPNTSKPAVYSEVLSNGSWRLVEGYDSSGRVLSELFSIDTAITTNPSLCKKVVYNYSSQHADDNLSREPNKPRKIETLWKGTLVAREYNVYAAGYHRVVSCSSPQAAITTLANEVQTEELVEEYEPNTTTIIRQTGFDGVVSLPSTTLSLDGSKTFVMDSGEPDSSGWAILNGFRVEEVSSPSGVVLTRNKWVIAGGSVGILIESMVASNFDFFDRPQRFDYLDGQFESVSYACCGIASKTEKDGSAVTHDYDVLGRQTTTIQHGVATISVLDAAGRVVEMRRLGTDSSVITQNGYGYDTSGFRTAQTNFITSGLFGVTTFSRVKTAGGFDQITTINPDGGSRVEKYLAAGLVDSITGTAVSPTRFVYGVASTTYGGGARICRTVQEIKLFSNGTDSSETSVSYSDGLGRVIKKSWGGSAASYTYFNNKGQRTKDIDPDGVTQLYRYDGQGDLVVVADDLNQNGFVDDYDVGYSGTDRVQMTTIIYLDAGDLGNSRGVPIRRTEKRIWTSIGSNATALVTTLDESLISLKRWSTTYKDQSTPLTVVTEIVPGATRTIRVTDVDLCYSLETYSFGRLITAKAYSASGALITSLSFSYDSHGRRSMQTDIRCGIETRQYNWADLVESISFPAPGDGQGPGTITNTYNSSMQISSTKEPDGELVRYEYYANGQLKKRYGIRTYPEEYTYDSQGRMMTLKTWQNFANNSGAAVTTWYYDSLRGWPISKTYNGESTGLEYGYTSAGRLKTRTWKRNGNGGNRIVTTYYYGFDDAVPNDQHGDLTAITYSNDSQTPPRRLGYDRRGRRIQIKTYAAGTASPNILNDTAVASSRTSINLNDSGMVTGESVFGGTLDGVSVNVGYNNHLRRDSLTVNTTPGYNVAYIYDNLGRLQSVTDGAYSGTYSYHPNSRLVSSLICKQGVNAKVSIGKMYDLTERLLRLEGIPAGVGQKPLVFNYSYNKSNQRASVSLNDNSYWLYQYDSLGQLNTARHYSQSGTPIAGQQFSYNSDTVGNRINTATGGDFSGLNQQAATYSVNLLNQYSSRTIPSVVQVTGLAQASAVVSVNGSSANEVGEYFWKEVAVNNGASSIWQSLQIQAVNGNTTNNVSGFVYVPKNPELFDDPATTTVNEGYDADGNQVRDGRWFYTWDAENRLIRIVSATSVGPQQRIDFEYDFQGRRVRKLVWNNTAGSGSPSIDIKFVYDDWNLVAELNGSNNSIIRSYVWGLDISNSMGNAGGAGGLLAFNSTSSGYHFVISDGNGNVSALVDSANGNLSGLFEYGPFGEEIRATGSAAGEAKLRFSSKYRDSETLLVYYGHRYYNPSTGRWLCRDPLQETSGSPLYSAFNNDPINLVDILGLEAADDGGMGWQTGCVRDFLRWQVGTPDWIKKVFSYLPGPIQPIDVKAKLNVQRQTCYGCCRKSIRSAKSQSGRIDFMGEGEYGTEEKTVGLIKYRAGWYARVGANVGISFSSDSCSRNSRGGYCGTGYMELGAIASIRDIAGKFEVGARVGGNVGVTICYVCDGNTGPDSSCYVRMRMCGSARARIWYKVKVFGHTTERASEESLNACTPWANIFSLP